ncbi:glycosyltransferase family 2 protein [Litoricolaceae bacterium]|nr:glycosyltransferase family 2 protein [Litorivicinaceae bacterium]
MYEISLLLPTRGRPHRLKCFVNSLLNTADNIDMIELVIYLDTDDICHDQISEYLDTLAINCVVISDSRTDMGSMLNKCFRASSGRLIGLVNDDVEIQTANWDRRISKEFLGNNKFLMTYPNDGFKGEGESTFPFFSREFFDDFYEPFPRYLGSHIDTHFFHLFSGLRFLSIGKIMYLPDVLFKHLHYRTNNDYFDSTYKERNRFGDDLYFLMSLQDIDKWLLQTRRSGEELFSWSRIERENLNPINSILIVSRLSCEYFNFKLKTKLFFKYFLRLVYHNLFSAK